MSAQRDPKQKRILSRVYIQDNGDVLVTDLWEEVREIITGEAGDQGETNAMDSNL